MAFLDEDLLLHCFESVIVDPDASSTDGEQHISYSPQGPWELVKCSGVCHFWRVVSDRPRLWLRLSLPTFSRANAALLGEAVRKLDKNATRQDGDSETLRRMTVVLESLTRKARD